MSQLMVVSSESPHSSCRTVKWKDKLQRGCRSAGAVPNADAPHLDLSGNTNSLQNWSQWYKCTKGRKVTEDFGVRSFSWEMLQDTTVTCATPEEVDRANHNIGSQGVKTIPGVLGKYASLPHINLWHNGIGNAGLWRLTESWSGQEGGLFLNSTRTEIIGLTQNSEEEEEEEEGIESFRWYTDSFPQSDVWSRWDNFKIVSCVSGFPTRSDWWLGG